ncbi:YALIA101S04e08922g1_1 [Yarrowia lipolytica]|nr:RINT1-like protein [Yarrowia lipolytica]SEI34045.1 YALIA101S04e08922g1_1 [Yarrowia lipolytica]
MSGHIGKISGKLFLDGQFATLADLESLDQLESELLEKEERLNIDITEAHNEASSLLVQHAQAVHDSVEEGDKKSIIAALEDLSKHELVDTNKDVQTAIKKAENLASSEHHIGNLLSLQQNYNTSTETDSSARIKSAIQEYLELNRRDVPTAVEALHKQWRKKLQRSAHTELQRLSQEAEEELVNCQYPSKEFQPSERLLSTLEEMIFLGSSLRTQSTADPQGVPLQAFLVLTAPYDIRLRFHFEGNKDTNQPDKPEWFYSYFLDIVEEQENFLQEHMQPLLGDSDKVALNEFICALIPSAIRKASVLFDALRDTSTELSHLLYETVVFETALKERYFYSPNRGNWVGISGSILTPSRFDIWLNVERNFAVSRFHAIIQLPDAWEIDFDGVERGATKPTKSALMVKDLLEGVTDHYRSLASVTYRLKFLIGIQTTILDLYHEQLHEQNLLLESNISLLSRALVGAADKQKTGGSEGIWRVCRIFGSAKFMIETLQVWGEDVFFLELWRDITSLNNSSRKEGGIDNDAMQTSATLPTDESDEGTLFDDTIKGYTSLQDRVYQTAKAFLEKRMQDGMKEYFKLNDWSKNVDYPDPENVPPSSQLSLPIQTMDKYLGIMRKCLSAEDMYQILKDFSKVLSEYFSRQVIMVNTFSAAGGQQLISDVREMWTRLGLPQDQEYHRIYESAGLLSSRDFKPSHLDGATVKSVVRRRA